MSKESIRHDISKAFQTGHQSKIKDEPQERKVQIDPERVAIATHKNIGEFIDGLRSHPEYLTKDGIGGRDVTIETGIPNQWEGLSDTAADFLGKRNDPGTPEVLSIRAYEVVGENTRIMEFTVSKVSQHEEKCRLVRVIATSMRGDRSVHLLFRNLSLTASPKPIVDAYKLGSQLQADGDFRHKMLVAASELVRFGGREAVKAIRARPRH